MLSHTGPVLEGRGRTDYERYIRTEELLALPKTPDQLINPEERLFQITHQTAELWLSQIDYELGRVVRSIEGGLLGQASHLLNRCTGILDLLREQIVLLEGMAPADYHVIRVSSLGRGSGQESPGFMTLLEVGDKLRPVVDQLLRERGLEPLDVLRAPAAHEELHRLVQALLDYDSAFMKWRYTHLRLALRVIGARVRSLKGVPVTQLEGGAREPLFPRLWDAISDLTEEHRPTY